ncbi:MAG TPA: DUF2007 domain-containing protein, partial [Thermoanaerobaculia bacterium]|nr:DUF2007 domain-containing protein [Thermoanaerobaculia bacterium]
VGRNQRVAQCEPPDGERAVICPECGSEYRDGFYRCADCDVALVAESDPRYVEPRDPARPATPQGNEDLELVLLFETTDPTVAVLAQSALEEAEIPFMAGADAVHRRISRLASELTPVQLWVSSDDETDARSVLEGIGGPLTEELDAQS